MSKGQGSDTSTIRCAAAKGIGSRFLVMIDDDKEPSIKEAAKQLCDSFDGIVELRSTPQPGVTLVRPDGYIAYSAHNHDSVAALGAVHSLLKRQIN